jgi:hypothetical protein
MDFVIGWGIRRVTNHMATVQKLVLPSMRAVRPIIKNKDCNKRHPVTGYLLMEYISLVARLQF